MLDGIGRAQAIRQAHDGDLRISGRQLRVRGLHFQLADRRRSVQDLSMKIAEFNTLVIDEPDPPHAGRRQI
jgi:hypothetical protein